ncbi:MAG: SDR family NAD(P)-dependent oxidoreductase [Acidimicrobiales bacterium]
MARVALVTGGARGIGRAICLELGRQGRRVAVADLLTDAADETAKAIVAAGGEAVSVRIDVTNTEVVQAAVDQVRAQLGPVEILVNNAGWDELKPFVQTDEDFWDRVIEINYKGVLRTVHTVLPAMMEAQWGRIVNLASDAGRVGSSMEAVYSGAKGGVIAFSKTIAREAARYGVTSNAVCPGPTETPLLDSIKEASADGDRTIAAMTKAVPLRRLGQPADLAAAVGFLTSDEAGFITGQTLSVSGGLTMA